MLCTYKNEKGQFQLHYNEIEMQEEFLTWKKHRLSYKNEKKFGPF